MIMFSFPNDFAWEWQPETSGNELSQCRMTLVLNVEMPVP
jgi:hypothetical protein